MNYFDAIFQGFVQGLTEFLPVSSSGHLSLVQYFTGTNSDVGLLFSVMLHFSTLLAIFIAFHRTIFELIAECFCVLKDVFTGKFTFKNPKPTRRMLFMLVVSLLPLSAYFFLGKYYRMVATDNSILFEGLAFLLTGAMLFIAEKVTVGTTNAKTVTARQALAVGVAQGVLSPFSGVSRSGSTIATGLLCGFERDFAVTFSFIMGMPAVGGATILELKGALDEGLSIPIGILLVGMLTALIVGLFAIQLVKWLVRYNKFKYFAYYATILGILVIAISIFETITNHSLQLFTS